MLRERDHQAEGPLPAWGGWREGAQSCQAATCPGWPRWCRVVREGNGLPPLAILQAPGCRSSHYSSGLEPSSGMAAARTTLAAWRRSVEGVGCGDVSKPSSSPLQQVPMFKARLWPLCLDRASVSPSAKQRKHLALPFREHSVDKNKIQKSTLTHKSGLSLQGRPFLIILRYYGSHRVGGVLRHLF